MRHRIGIVLAVVMTGALFFPGAWGYLRLLRVPAPSDQLSGLPAGGGSLIPEHHVLLALAAVAGTALLAAILIAASRVSPLAAGLPGLLLLGWTGLYLASVRQAVDLIPLRADPFGAGFEAMLFNGVLGAAGLGLVVPLFIPARWRARRPAVAEEFFPAVPEPAVPAPAVPELAGQPTTQLNPIRATTLTPIQAAALAPLPGAPWHDAETPAT